MTSKRRPSAVSNELLNFGDTETPSFSTTHDVNQLRASRSRQRALSGSRAPVSEGLGTDASSAASDATGNAAGSTTSSSTSGADKSVAKQSGATVTKKKKHAKRNIPPASGLRRLWLQYRELAFHNSWLNPFLLLAFFMSWFAWDGFSEDSWLYPYICLSYKIPGTEPPLYGKGRDDFKFVAFYILFFIFYREFWMGVILRPLAKAVGITKRGKTHRFMEQAYALVYYGASGPLGLYIMYHSDLWYFNTRAFYENFPHREHEFLFKLFYLLQASFWGQQALILCLLLEKPRKDFQELVFHHIVTIALIWLSYRFHFMKMGIAVYISMDVSDFFLSVSKICNYLGFEWTPIVLGFFAIVWVYMRHWLNLKFMWSILTEFRTVGDFTLNWDTQQYKCWISQYITFFLIFSLHLLNLYWLRLIVRIGYRAVTENVQKDERSEDEDDDDDDDDEHEDNDEHDDISDETSSSDDEKRKTQ